MPWPSLPPSVAISLGHDPVWFGIALVLLVAVGLIAAPVGMDLFVMKGIAPNIKLGDIADGAMVFCGAITGRLLPIYFMPDLVTWLPQRMRCSSTPRNASKSKREISPMAYVAMY